MSKQIHCHVTGMDGFIGKHLCKRLVEEGHTVEPAGMVFTKYECDVLIHLAAHNNIRCEFDPKLVESNIIYAKEMLTQPCRTLFASSTSASELSNPYAYSKQYGEYLCSLHPDALAFRLFNVYGPGCKRGIVKAILDYAFLGRPMTIQKGMQLRDFIFVDDVCEIFMHHLQIGTGIIDVGTGVGTNMDELVYAISKIIGRGLVFRSTEFNKGQQEISVANPPGNFYFTDLYTGLEKTIEAYKKENGL